MCGCDSSRFRNVIHPNERICAFSLQALEVTTRMESNRPAEPNASRYSSFVSPFHHETSRSWKTHSHYIPVIDHSHPQKSISLFFFLFLWLCFIPIFIPHFVSLFISSLRRPRMTKINKNSCYGKINTSVLANLVKYISARLSAISNPLFHGRMSLVPSSLRIFIRCLCCLFILFLPLHLFFFVWEQRRFFLIRRDLVYLRY